MEKETKKRKREEDTDPPRITFITPSKTFERLFKETSLDSTKDLVRKKLGLKDTEAVELSQVRDGRIIDLEDDDDFDAFRVHASFSRVVEVKVQLPGSSSLQGSEPLQEQSTVNIPGQSALPEQTDQTLSARNVTFEKKGDGKAKSRNKQRKEKAERGSKAAQPVTNETKKASVITAISPSQGPVEKPGSRIKPLNQNEPISSEDGARSDIADKSSIVAVNPTTGGGEGPSRNTNVQSQGQGTKSIRTQKRKRRKSTSTEATNDNKDTEAPKIKKLKGDSSDDPKHESPVTAKADESMLNNAIAAVLARRFRPVAVLLDERPKTVTGKVNTLPVTQIVQNSVPQPTPLANRVAGGSLCSTVLPGQSTSEAPDNDHGASLQSKKTPVETIPLSVAKTKKPLISKNTTLASNESISTGQAMMPLSFHPKPTPSQARKLTTSHIPSGSVLSEVPVQSKDEGSSSESEVSESSDTESESSSNDEGNKSAPKSPASRPKLQESLDASSASVLLQELMKPQPRAIDAILDSLEKGSTTPEREEDLEEEESSEHGKPLKGQRPLRSNRSSSPSESSSDDGDAMDSDTNVEQNEIDDGNRADLEVEAQAVEMDTDDVPSGNIVDATNEVDRHGMGESVNEGSEQVEEARITTTASREGPASEVHEGSLLSSRKENDDDIPSNQEGKEDDSQPNDHVNSQTPAFGDVYARAESYISEHIANGAVNDAMADDIAFLRGEVPHDKEPVVEQLDDNHSEASTKVDAAGIESRSNAAPTRLNENSEGDCRLENSDGRRNGDDSIRSPNCDITSSVKPSDTDSFNLPSANSQNNDLPSTPGRVKRMRGKVVNKPVASSNRTKSFESEASVVGDEELPLETSTRRSTRKSLAASKSENSIVPITESSQETRRYNTRRSTSNIKPDSQVVPIPAPKSARSKRGGRLGAVVEDVQETGIKLVLEPVVEIPVLPPATQSPKLSRSFSAAFHETGGESAKNKKDQVRSLSGKQKKELASSSPTEIEYALDPDVAPICAISNAEIPSSLREPSPTSSHTDEVDLLASSPPPPPRRKTRPRPSLRQSYRSLQELASSQDLFQSAVSRPTTFTLTPVKSFGKAGEDDDDDDDDDDDEDEDDTSDSDAEEATSKSALNIPKEKMAGSMAVRPREKRKSLLATHF